MPKVRKFELEETPFPTILLQLSDFQLTGRIEATNNGTCKSIYLDAGQFVYAHSNEEHDRIGMVLVSGGKLSVQQLKEALARQTAGKKLGVLLVEQSLIKISDLEWAIKQQAKQIIMSLFNWEEGNASFFQEELSAGIIKLQLNTQRIIIEGIKEIASPRIILKGLGDLDLPVKAIINPAMIEDLSLRLDQLVFLKSIVNKEMSIREICDLSSRPPWETCQMLYLLMATGCLTHSLRNATFIA
ncbi:MAG: hypothetical protein A2Y62_11700 [Candidatus Fischerbacteria bacterium RBG_13_37_8]|uniref:PatA-like N-terminal domain-containing protein n=1 Tax=Candidatus Fischerbacteria bacterium RBG_13_37_8 TaxID=1817863 RepID=A0A1F5VI19_9BACT|nr:MAG: hypothetical protein A2Y62_11700 [Candidatus Fischerbacteria bacterium RBG_13_37_8]